MRIRPLLLFVGLVLPLLATAAPDWRESAQTALHMLDYVGVDYPEFVKDGKVLDQDEYQEQLEFSNQVVVLLNGLPQNPQRARLIEEAQTLARAIVAKRPGAQIAAASGTLRWAIIAAYGLSVAPKKAPDLARGAKLFGENCASCHGAEGRGDGPAAKGLDPAPSNFHDAARMVQRSVYGLYNTITLGVAGTGMAAYRALGEDDRWALAFYVSRFPVSAADLAKGEAAWKSGAHQATFADFENLATLSTDEVKKRFGNETAFVQHWLRAHPEAVSSAKPSPIRFSIDSLRESLAAYRKGDRAAAQQLAVSAYLEGFELVEASLDNVDAKLRLDVEREMMAYRNLLKSGATPDAVETQMRRTVELLGAAEQKLNAGAMPAGSTFTASLLILLREGLEAILVLAAIIAFLIKSERRDALPWVHAGWLSALALGAVTWLVATYVVGISGAGREMTEGVTALIAAGMLVYVGYWLHSKSYAAAWQHFIRNNVSTALEKRTLWAMAAVSFLAVYRELFEIVLFYQALAAQTGEAGRAPLIGGILLATVLLAAIAWGIFRYGIRLPIGSFFTVTSVLLVVLAATFAGQGIAALQEAGVIDIDPVNFIHLPALGIFPTIQTLAAQAFVGTVVVVSFYFTRRAHRSSTAS
jgi:high-affinity iron transporter